MRRTLLASLLVMLFVVAGSATARAASVAGEWSATYNKSSTIVLRLKASGAGYTGTYTFITRYTQNKVKKTAQSVQPVTAKVQVVQKVTTVLLTFPKTKVTATCGLVKSQLRCVAPAMQKLIVFSYVKG